MKKIGLSILGLLVVVIITLAFIAPGDFQMSREIIINRPAAQVYTYAKTMQNATLWNAWLKLDPNIKINYRGISDGEVGFISAWESSNPDVGTAEQEITKLIDNTRIDTEIRFKQPFEASFNSYMLTEAQNPQQTKVTMGMHDEIPFPMYIISFVYNLCSDNQVKTKKNMDESLAALKAILEGGN